MDQECQDVTEAAALEWRGLLRRVIQRMQSNVDFPTEAVMAISSRNPVAFSMPQLYENEGNTFVNDLIG